MPTPLRRRLRLVRRGAWYTAAMLLVAMALVAGVTSQLLPLAERNPERIAAWLSARAGRTIAFDTVESDWTRRGPLLRVSGLRVGDGAAAVPIGEAEILVAQYAGLLPGRSFTEVRLRNLVLTVERAADGRWSVRGLPGQQQAGADPFATLEGLGELQVIAARLVVEAPSLSVTAVVPRINLRLRVDGDRVRAGARAWMHAGGPPLDLALEFARGSGDGRLYAGASRVDLAAWAPFLQMGGPGIAAGRGRAAAWADLRARRVAAVTVDAVLDDVEVRARARPAPGAPEAARVGFARVEARARWRAVTGGWRLDAPRLRIATARGAAADSGAPDLQSLDGLVLAGGRHYGLQAQRIDAAPVLALAALADGLEPGLRRWLRQAGPRAILHEVSVAGVRGGALRARARIEALAFAPVGRAPGLSGLSGHLLGDGAGFRFQIDAGAPVRVDWPHGFSDAHVVALRGAVSGWREAGGWRIATPALRIDGRGYGADLRAGLLFQGDGSRPLLDLAVRLDDAAIGVARRFWTARTLPPAAVRWLDAALLSGQVRGGRAIVSGDLDDWPFRHREGTFEARGRLAGLVLRYHPDWPASERLDGDVHFTGQGFQLVGNAAVAGLAIPAVEGGITDYGEGILRVRTRLAGDASRMLALLRDSPLQRRHGAALANLSVAGPATGTFALDLPLHGDAPMPSIAGNVVLRGAKVAHPEWKLAFSDVRGTLRYDQDGFTADDLAATQDAQPGRLSLRAGRGHVREREHAFEAELAATLAADSLLRRAPQLAWLLPHIRGRSPWTLAVAIPAAGPASGVATPSRLRLRSTLVGTTLDLPAPLDKASATPLATSIDVALPLADGDVILAFGERLALRARSQGKDTGIRVVLGSDRVLEAPPASGVVATGATDRLEALDWMALARGGGGSGGNALPLRRIDVTAARLQLLGASFADTRVQVSPAAGGTAVRFDGAALSGALMVPTAGGATVAGRLQRLHWRSAGGTSNRATASAAPVRDVDIDPAAIPPLNLVVDDVRMGEATIGAARLRTRPINGGLRIDQLQATAPQQRIEVTGDWTGRGAQARTRVDARVTSADFGSLLAGFGLGAQLDKGHGEARLEARWPGSPASFRLAGLEGSLALLAKDGRLVEIEPGAGRVLGLLSLAMIPRRLTLDFRDFFSRGFAFNRMAGTLRFAGGTARSDDLVIEGAAADISIRGSANLRAQTFDQTIEVLPKTGNLLTAVGAIAGGPVGAAVGAVANAMLTRPIGLMSARTYRVTGPWKDPKVEVIGREQGRMAARPPPAG